MTDKSDEHFCIRCDQSGPVQEMRPLFEDPEDPEGLGAEPSVWVHPRCMAAHLMTGFKRSAPVLQEMVRKESAQPVVDINKQRTLSAFANAAARTGDVQSKFEDAERRARAELGDATVDAAIGSEMPRAMRIFALPLATIRALETLPKPVQEKLWRDGIDVLRDGKMVTVPLEALRAYEVRQVIVQD
jgi:hypothetical protein